MISKLANFTSKGFSTGDFSTGDFLPNAQKQIAADRKSFLRRALSGRTPKVLLGLGALGGVGYLGHRLLRNEDTEDGLE